MIHAYDNQYLDDAMKCLGEAMDYAANSCQMNMDSFLELFIGTGYAEQFAAGVPKYVSGVSGTASCPRGVPVSWAFSPFAA